MPLTSASAVQAGAQTAQLRPLARQIVDLLANGTHVPQTGDSLSADLIAWCRHNKFSLLCLEESLPNWAIPSKECAAAICDEHMAYDTQHREYLQVHEAWLARGVPCLMIKSAGETPSFPHTSDNIDILVRPEQGVAARDTLRDLGYVEVRNVEEPQKHLFRKFHEGRCVSAIHVHERIAWFVGFLDDDAVWERSRTAGDDPAITIPSPEDAILINLAHACYENKCYRLIDLYRVRVALEFAGPDLDWGYMEHTTSHRGWRDGWAFMMLVHSALEEALFGESLVPHSRRTSLERLVSPDTAIWKRIQSIRAMDQVDLPIDLHYYLCKRLYYRKILTDPVRRRADRWRDVAATLVWGIRLKSHVRPQPGYVVSLSGVDGAGKTAHALALIDALRVCELTADYRWRRGGSTGLARTISWLRHRMRRGRSPIEEQLDAITRRQRQLAHPLRRFAWSWLVAFDEVAASYRDAISSRVHGRIIVRDRYAYDTAVEMDVSLPSTARRSRSAIKFMLAHARQSDIGYVLDISPETAPLRKSAEAWHLDLGAERRRYVALASRFALKLRSNDGTFAETSDPLIREVIMDYMARYETRLNALFYANPSQKNTPDPIWARGAAR